MNDKKSLGAWGEQYACEYLEHKGFSIIGRNVRQGRCEIDIIAENDVLTAFVEVKTRAAEGIAYTTPAGAVNYKKRENLRNAVRAYLNDHGNPDDRFIRFDVAEIIASSVGGEYRALSVNYIEGAFTASERERY